MFDQPTADFVVAYRQFGPYQGPLVPDSGNLTVDPKNPAKFKFNTVLDLVGVTVQVTSPNSDDTLTLTSPFSTDPQAMQDYLPRLMDYTSVQAGPVLVGRINIDLAPDVVLACLPAPTTTSSGRSSTAGNRPTPIPCRAIAIPRGSIPTGWSTCPP